MNLYSLWRLEKPRRRRPGLSSPQGYNFLKLLNRPPLALASRRSPFKGLDNLSHNSIFKEPGVFPLKILTWGQKIREPTFLNFGLSDFRLQGGKLAFFRATVNFSASINAHSFYKRCSPDCQRVYVFSVFRRFRFERTGVKIPD